MSVSTLGRADTRGGLRQEGRELPLVNLGPQRIVPLPLPAEACSGPTLALPPSREQGLSWDPEQQTQEL